MYSQNSYPQMPCPQPMPNQRIPRPPRQPRVVVTSVSMGLNDNNDIVVYAKFSDGYTNARKMITNFNGPIKVYNIEFLDWSIKNARILIFIGDDKFFIAEKNKIEKGDYIYKLFLTEGIHFDATLKPGLIKEALQNFFLSHMPTETEPVRIKALAGWNSSLKFQFKENTFLEPYFSTKEAPVIGKSFTKIQVDKAQIAGYFAELQQFPEWSSRLIMLLYPFLGLLHSLLGLHQKKQNFYLNLVAMEDFPSDYAAAWLQIFNRSQSSVVEAAHKTEKEFNWQLMTICDEVFIIDTRTYPGESQYSKKKKINNSNRLAHIVNHDVSLPNGKKLCAVAALISNEFRSGNVINLVLPPMSQINEQTHFQLTHNRCIESVLSGVVAYVENNQETVQQMMRKKRAHTDCRVNLLETVLDILQQFFAAEGYNLKKELRLPKYIDFLQLFDDGKDSDDGVVKTFIILVRTAIYNYTAVEKGYGVQFQENSFYFDDEWLYFPCTMLREMFQRHHCYRLFQRAVLLLKADGILCTDAENLTVKKVQLNGYRSDFYVIPRELFNAIGYIDIIALAKEVR